MTFVARCPAFRSMKQKLLASLVETRRALLALLLVLLNAPASAAQQVKGSVHDRVSASPLNDALVTLLDTTGSMAFAVRTDKKGRYILKIPEPGVYAVMATHPAHERVVSGWLTVEASDTLDVVLRLSPNATTLEPVLITAQRDSLLDLTVSGIPLKTLSGTVVTLAEFERASSSTTNFTEAVQNLHIPSLTLRYYRVSTGNSRIDGDRTCLAYGRRQ